MLWQSPTERTHQYDQYVSIKKQVHSRKYSLEHCRMICDVVPGRSRRSRWPDLTHGGSRKDAIKPEGLVGLVILWCSTKRSTGRASGQ